MLQYHSVSLGSFPSLWLQLLQCSVESQLVVPDLDEENLPLKSHHLQTSYSIRRLAAVTNMHHRIELHSSMNFIRFHTFTTQKPNNRTLFFPCTSQAGQPSLYWYCDGVRASALCCHLQAILHAVCSTLTNLHDNSAKFRFFYYKFKVFIWLTSPQFYDPAFCILLNFMYFLQGPSQMPVCYPIIQFLRIYISFF